MNIIPALIYFVMWESYKILDLLTFGAGDRGEQ